VVEQKKFDLLIKTGKEILLSGKIWGYLTSAIFSNNVIEYSKIKQSNFFFHNFFLLLLILYPVLKQNFITDILNSKQKTVCDE